VKFGLHALHRGDNIARSELTDLAKLAEAAGFESLWVGDHIALPDDAPDPATEPRLEALIALTYLAAVTNRVRLGVGVLVLPQRQPVLLAKQLTSIDVLSHGRLLVGVAGGHVRAELAALGVDMSDRAALTDEYLDVLVSVWKGQTEFVGPTVEFTGVTQQPPPTQSPHPPLIVGGHAPAAWRRAAKKGDGWFGWGLTPETTADHMAELTNLRQEHGRADSPFEVTVVPAGQLAASLVGEYEDVGVDRLVVVPDSFNPTATRELIEHVGSQLIR
jgi:probable F420-dependent oxidoreductase